MKKIKLKALMLAGVMALSVGFVACGTDDIEEKKGESSKVEAKGDNETLVYGSGDYTSINPAIKEHGEINSLIFTGLTARDKNNNIIPALAESWEFDKASDTYTFKLRTDVKWHDGEPFTSKDVKFTIETIQNPDSMSEIASNYEDIESVEIVSDSEVKIKLKEPNVAILDYLTVGIIPEHILAGKDITTSEFNKKPIGTGPYKLDKWDTGQSITLVKNTEYYKGEPEIDNMIFKIVTDAKAKALQLKSGELDLAQITPKDMPALEGNEDFEIHEFKTADYRGIMYNFNSDFFKANKDLPNALSYGIDREVIIDSVLLGQGYTAYSPLQAGPYNNPDMEKFEYNPQKAKEEIEKLGWKLGANKIYEKDGQKLAFEIVCGEGDQVRIDMANICSQQFKEIGVETKVTVNAEVDWANQDTYLIGWGSPFDPDDHTYKVFGTDKGANYNGYSNAKVDELLKAARATDDNDERLKLYKEFQEEMALDMPYTYIAYIDAIYAAEDKLKGLSSDTVLGHHGVGIFFNVDEWTISQD
ncbi:ABC transporter substrate-binding protein [uncultured Clostridium sp.]|jgi:peptide/nickel transport system substrate-binding protein|uniref:ABC transporter substrate-binding protein n=1 Tax=uncultured Clostridium sp. TaxID=59620 RepID=UPI002613FB4F|nr:ABC transporter substrate-binding protein [uncultured Clostridium sp.]